MNKIKSHEKNIKYIVFINSTKKIEDELEIFFMKNRKIKSM